MNVKQKFSGSAAALAADVKSVDPRMALVLLAGAVLIITRRYVFNSGFYKEHWRSLNPLFPLGSFDFMRPQLWWAAGSVLLYLVVAGLVVRFALKMKLADCGLRPGAFVRFLPLVIGLLAVMIPIVIYASSFAEFRKSYPFPGTPTGETVAFFLVWELAYGLQFLAHEFFFRGFLLFPLEKKLGYNAILVMVVPYAMVHFGKPMAETYGAVAAGCILGYIALKSRSIWPCFALHFAVAFTMDLCALCHSKSFFLNQ